MLQFKCFGSSPALSICIDKQCNQNAFICCNQQCCSPSRHKNCQKIQIQQFFNHYEHDRIRQNLLIQNIQQFYDKIWMKIKNDALHYSQWVKNRFTKEKLILQYKAQAESLTGHYFGELIDGWINCDEDFAEQVKFCVNHASKTILKQLEEMREIFVNLKKRVDEGKNPRNSRNSTAVYDINSSIVWREEEMSSLRKLLNSELKIKEVNLIFQGEKNKFSATAFHEVCDGKSNTLILSKNSKNQIIGGFTPVSWQSDNFGKFKTDNSQKSFLFSVTKEEKYPLYLKEYAIQCNCFCGPVFGKGAFWIENDSPNNESYWSEIPSSYRPVGKQWTEESYQEFIGAKKSQKFTIDEWEVFEIVFD